MPTPKFDWNNYQRLLEGIRSDQPLAILALNSGLSKNRTAELIKKAKDDGLIFSTTIHDSASPQVGELSTDSHPSLDEPLRSTFQYQPPTKVTVEKTVILSDVHCPFHDPQAIKVTLNFIAFYQPDTIYLNGDILDCYAISSFDKDPKRQLKFQDELDSAYDFILSIREAAPKAKVIYTEGNHEFRLTRFLIAHPEVSSLRALHIRNLLHLDELGVRWVSARDKEYCNGVKITHGSRISKWSAYTAKQEYDAAGVSGCSGHSHRASLYRHRDETGDHIWMEGGCLCLLDPEYMNGVTNWQQSFIIGETSTGGHRFQLSHVNIANGKILYQGHLFQ